VIESYPLYWPEGWKRTPANERQARNAFQVSRAQARDHLLRQLDLLWASSVIISTNVPVKANGSFYADTREPDDPGVAVYFKYQGKSMCFACDRYVSVRSNTRAIGLTIEAIRTIERHGASDMMERAFRGFAALPEKATEPWRAVLEIGHEAKVSPDEIEEKFRDLALKHHPDHGGDPDKFRAIVEARHQAKKELATV
jgi:hypothetical protein